MTFKSDKIVAMKKQEKLNYKCLMQEINIINVRNNNWNTNTIAPHGLCKEEMICSKIVSLKLIFHRKQIHTALDDLFTSFLHTDLLQLILFNELQNEGSNNVLLS